MWFDIPQIQYSGMLPFIDIRPAQRNVQTIAQDPSLPVTQLPVFFLPTAIQTSIFYHLTANNKQPNSLTAKQPNSQTAKQPNSQTAKQPNSQIAKQPNSQTAK